MGRNEKKTILIVDDNDMTRDSVAELLRPHGFLALRAAGGDEALALAERQEGGIDLLLTDVVMPGMMGQSLAARLLRKHPSAKVLFMSGYMCPGQANTKRSNRSSDPRNFLLKPFTEEQLLKKIRQLLK